MLEAASESVEIRVDASHGVSGLWRRPSHARCALALAPGAGAGITHAFMADMAGELAERRVATLRYQFPYMQRGSRRPDPPALCHATVRAAVGHLSQLAGSLPLFAGGKSFGGRMTSQAQAGAALCGVRGLVFLGFPLHPAKQPAEARGEHLAKVQIPLLFLQGTRDELADLASSSRSLSASASMRRCASWRLPTTRSMCPRVQAAVMRKYAVSSQS